jgi:hypothetical protein
VSKSRKSGLVTIRDTNITPVRYERFHPIGTNIDLVN